MFELVVGDRGYSSWSMRPWLLFDVFDIPVKIRFLRLYSNEVDYRRVLETEYYPAKTVPVLKTPDGVIISESLAICEELASRCLDKQIFPANPKHRAIARFLMSEMHSGFSHLRSHCTMNLRCSYVDCEPTKEVLADVERIEKLWKWAKSECNPENKNGPWLCGSYSAVDAFYAPIAGRIATYNLKVSKESQDYVNAHLHNDSFRRWRAIGLSDAPNIEKYERNYQQREWPGPKPLKATIVEGSQAVNATCPYSGKPVTHVLEFQGQRFGFCNALCRNKTAADPEVWPKFMALVKTFRQHSGQLFQTIDGFGGSTSIFDQRASLSPSEAELFFSASRGIGLSLLRFQVSADGSCSNLDSPSKRIACVGGTFAQTNAEFAKSYNVKMWSSPFRLASRFTSNGRMNPNRFREYAQYLFNYTMNFNHVIGVPLIALSIQNEPESFDPRTTGWTPQMMSNFLVNYLSPTFKGSGIRLMMPECAAFDTTKWYLQSGGNPIQNDIVGFHNYDGYLPTWQTPLGINFHQNQSFWLTEVCGMLAFDGPSRGEWDPSWTDAMTWAVYIHTWLVKGRVNAFHWWWLKSPTYSAPPGRRNQALMSSSGRIAARTWIIGSFSKFIRPGFIRIFATDNPRRKVFVSAYRNSANTNLVIVAINSNLQSVSQSFQLKIGFRLSSIVPWVSAPGALLVSRPAITNYNYRPQNQAMDHSFVYTLLPQSVTTFNCVRG